MIYSWLDPSVSTDTFFLASRIDSTVMEGNATASYFMRIDRPSLPTDTLYFCGDPTAYVQPPGLLYDRDHYFGKKMLYENGLCSFISSNGDTFQLQSQAPLGASWQWSPGVTATVSNIGLGSVSAQADSLKTINLSNGEYITLAKDNGLVHAFTFLPFAENYAQDTQKDLEFFGNRTLGIGRDIPNAEAYRPKFDTNDKICWKQNRNYGGAAYVDFYRNRLYSDSLNGCPHHVLTFYDETYERIQAQGTITVTYQAPTLFTPNCNPPSPMDGILDLLPYETQPAYYNIPPPYHYWIRRGQSLKSNVFGRNAAHLELTNVLDTCARIFFTFEELGTQTYVEDIGLFDDYYGYLDQSYVTEHTYVEAYQLGSEAYGTCTDLHALGVDKHQLGKFSLHPNPFKDKIQLEISENIGLEQFEIVVMDLNGREMLHDKVQAQAGKMQIDLQALPSGLYFLQLRSNDQLLGHEKIVKSK
jgi:hypothetical protein